MRGDNSNMVIKCNSDIKDFKDSKIIKYLCSFCLDVSFSKATFLHQFLKKVSSAENQDMLKLQ